MVRKFFPPNIMKVSILLMSIVNERHADVGEPPCVHRGGGTHADGHVVGLGLLDPGPNPTLPLSRGDTPP
jgi:hypothetical protein